MTVGFIMLCHTALDRAAQVARFWADAGCPIVIHIDRRVKAAQYDGLVAALADIDSVSFSRRYVCEWGAFSLVAATQAAAEQMLERHSEVRHVYLSSGACLPLRPAQELIDYLDARPSTDFIESVTTADVGWTIGGLDAERFTLRFPFSWRRQ
ncbi:MAG: beta-1,6-N-acetylglucosaminyltransferase, partial [Albidovulum sp.]|uniref:beta-1,6-N-acetylglucosaminyltransferase n=1 Tax=Albidovulum sp. TaxID=1872424 RepID=UPI003C907C8B